MMVEKFSATSLHDLLTIEWLDEFRKRFTCCEVYKLVNGQGPNSLVNMFEQVKQLSSDSNVHLESPRTRTIFPDNDFAVHGMSNWRCLPADIQHSPWLETFKTSLRKHAPVPTYYLVYFLA